MKYEGHGNASGTREGLSSSLSITTAAGACCRVRPVMPHGLFEFSKLGKTPTCKHHASPNESPLHALLAQVQCTPSTHAGGIFYCIVHKSASAITPFSPHCGPKLRFGGCPLFTFGNTKKWVRGLEWAIFNAKIDRKWGGFTPCSRTWPPDGHVARCAQVGILAPIP